MKYKLAAIFCAALAGGCGGGGDPVLGVAANTTVATTGAAAAAVVNVPFSFSSGVAALGTNAATTVQFTSSSATPAFNIASGGATATGTTTFGSCIFAVTSSTFPTGHALALGQTPRDMFLHALGRAADPASGGRQMFGHFSSRALRIVSGSSSVGSHPLHAVGLAWALALALCLGVWWPLGPLRRLGLAQRLQLAGGVLLSVAVVSLLKSFNPAACPWSLAAYGGATEPVSHWLWWATPVGGRGGCFPAGHASAGFGFIGGYFVFRPVAPALARRWLLAAVAAGLLLGISQQWRGAHFMSHTLWSGWLCWCVAWALDGACRSFSRSAAPVGAA